MSDEPEDTEEDNVEFSSIDFGPREFQGTKTYADLADALDTEDDAQLRAAIFSTFVENDQGLKVEDWIKHCEAFFHYIKSGRLDKPDLRVHRGGANKTVEPNT